MQQSVSRNELDQVKEKSKAFLRQALEAKKALEGKVSALEDEVRVLQGVVEQLRDDNTALRLGRAGGSGAGSGAVEGELDRARVAAAKAEEELIRYTN